MGVDRKALVIGINNYLYGLPKLSMPEADATAIAEILEKYGGFKVSKLPKNPESKLTRNELKTEIENLFSPDGEQIPKTAVLFFAGHGLREKFGKASVGYLATSESDDANGAYGLSLQLLRELLQKSPVKEQIVWLDCCHAGEFIDSLKEANPGDTKGYSRCFIAACRDYQSAHGEEGHGVLTKALLSALNLEKNLKVTTKTLVAGIIDEFQKVKLNQEPIHECSDDEIIITYRSPGKLADSRWMGIPPYKGLEFFDYNRADAELFYGRQEMTRKLLHRVEKSNFLIVTGASGSGKSSIVRAGLLYELQKGECLTGSDRWLIISPFTPGEEPLKNLEKAIAQSLPRSDADASPVPQPLEMLRQILQTRDYPVVLVVDQFEEAFTLCKDKSQQKQFFDDLMDLGAEYPAVLKLLLVMRSDFFNKLTEPESIRLADKINEDNQSNLVTVTVMKSAELEQAIREPLKKVNLLIEDSLVHSILEDLGVSKAEPFAKEPGSLPLLEYTLDLVWQERYKYHPNHLLQLRSYEELGGVKGALEKQANKVYDFLSPEYKQMAQWIFLKLTSINEGTEDTRRQVYQQNLINQKHPQDLVEKVVKCLADSRLVITSEEKLKGEQVAVVNIAHEALIRNWSKLREWIANQREAELIRRRLEAKVQEWERLDRNGGLLDERELDDAQNWRESLDAQCFGVEKKLDELVEASDLAIKENKLQQLTTLTETQFAFNKQLDALETAIQAGEILKKTSSRIRENIKIRVLTNFNKLIYGFRERISIKEHTEGVLGINFSSDGKQIVSTSIDETIKILKCDGQLIQTINEHKARVYNAIFNNKNDRLVSASEDKTIKIWKIDLNNCFRLDKCIYVENQVFNIALSPNNQIIASDTGIGKIKLWDLSGKLITTLDGHSERINDLNFSPDGQIIASASSDGCIKLWSTENHNCIYTIPINQVVLAVNFVNNQTIVLGTNIGFVMLYYLDKKEPPILIGSHSDSITRLAVNQDRKIIASASSDFTIKIWDIQDRQIELGRREPLKILKGHENCVTNVSFNPATTDDRKMLASSSEDGTIRIWTAISPTIIDGLYFSFAPDSQMIVTGHEDGSIKLLWFENGNQKSIREHNSNVLRVKFSPNGKSFVSTSLDKTVKIWNSEGKVYQTLEDVNYAVTSISFSLDSKTIATASFDENMVDIWDIENGKKITTFPTSKRVKNVSFSHDGQTLAVVNSGDNKINFWKLDDEKVINTLTATSSISSISFSKKGHIAAACNQDIVDCWYFEGTQYQKKLSKKLRGNLLDIAFSPDSQTIIVACEEKTVILFLNSENLTDSSLIREPTNFYSNYDKNIQQVGFSPNGKILASTNNNDKIILWNFDLEKLLDLTLQSN